METIQTDAVSYTRISNQVTKRKHYRKMMKKMRKARRRWQKGKCPAGKIILNNKAHELKREIHRIKEEY